MEATGRPSPFSAIIWMHAEGHLRDGFMPLWAA